MEMLNYKDEIYKINFTKNEVGMLACATGGAVFKGTHNRKIPAVKNWQKDEAIALEKKLQDTYKKTINEIIMLISKKELEYLIVIHEQNMEELDPIEYPTITGYPYANAKKLLNSMINLVTPK